MYYVTILLALMVQYRYLTPIRNGSPSTGALKGQHKYFYYAYAMA